MDTNQNFVISSVNENQIALRERFQDLGYLLFKQYVSQDNCNSLLDSILDEIDPYITNENNRAPDAHRVPVYNGTSISETDLVWDEVYPKIQSLEEFHRFFHEPHILALMETITGTDAFVYPIKMARISTPGKVGHETPPHQDAYSHHAGPTMAGIWVALHDITHEMGRVKVLPGSHKKGVRKVFTAEGVGGVQCEIFPDETCWHVSDFDQGDVLIFHSATIHKAEPNTSERRARISVDTRFCDYGAPVFSTNLEPHHGWRIEGLNWNSIYQNWKRKDLQHYWLNYPNLF